MLVNSLKGVDFSRDLLDKCMMSTMSSMMIEEDINQDVTNTLEYKVFENISSMIEGREASRGHKIDKVVEDVAKQFD